MLARKHYNPDSVLAAHTAVSAALGFLVTLIWGLTGAGYFWPVWVWFGLAIPLAIDFSWWYSRQFEGRREWLALHMSLTAVASAALIMIWALSGGGAFWPGIPVICLLGLVVCHLFISENWDRLFKSGREKVLTERVDQLTRTRQGTLEAQAAQLRQVERDLHDGAQSRLVALSMQLARAEAKLDDQPEAAKLVRQARAEAGEAIAELRDLARGIAPPVLADRGLAEAARSLGTRNPGGVTIESTLERRPPPIIETGAYFVIAESLTNAAKHAPGVPVTVSLAEGDGQLNIVIKDEGPGGADPKGNGLTGLLHRVEALDGRMGINSPPGEGTVIRVDLPCE
ncbi:MAG TPA: histidine kinase [Solirubrobacterales bacterium]|nr:histidine kinase [Solirubrobacterales bacterium]